MTSHFTGSETLTPVYSRHENIRPGENHCDQRPDVVFLVSAQARLARPVVEDLKVKAGHAQDPQRWCQTPPRNFQVCHVTAGVPAYGDRRPIVVLGRAAGAEQNWPLAGLESTASPGS